MKQALLTLVILFNTQPLLAESFTISPISFTEHGTADKSVVNDFNNTFVSDTTTVHPGITLLYKQKYMQYAGWFFLDSFGNPAGGLMAGPKFDFFNHFSLGATGGVYVREKPKDVKDLPTSVTIADSAELIVMGGVTASANLPITDTYGTEVNCLINLVVNNCSIGLKISW